VLYLYTHPTIGGLRIPVGKSSDHSIAAVAADAAAVAAVLFAV